MAGSMNNTFFEAPCFALVTGASRGIGRAIAIEFAKRFEKKLHLVLTSRTETGLQETVSLITRLDQYSSERITIKLVPGDLGNEAEFPSILDQLFDGIDHNNYQHAVLVNNAARTGDITKFVREYSAADVPSIHQDLFLSVTVPLLLSSKLLATFPSHRSSDYADQSVRRTIVQITSRAGQIPFASWSQYCTGKAARDMLHKVIAAEEPNVRVLSYSPGPVDTAMLHDAVDHSASPATSQRMTQFLAIAVTPAKTADVMCNVLDRDEYESGAIVHISDVISYPEFTKKK